MSPELFSGFIYRWIFGEGVFMMMDGHGRQCQHTACIPGIPSPFSCVLDLPALSLQPAPAPHCWMLWPAKGFPVHGWKMPGKLGCLLHSVLLVPKQCSWMMCSHALLSGPLGVTYSVTVFPPGCRAKSYPLQHYPDVLFSVGVYQSVSCWCCNKLSQL